MTRALIVVYSPGNQAFSKELKNSPPQKTKELFLLPSNERVKPALLYTNLGSNKWSKRPK
jgi:hypothetical protein